MSKASTLLKNTAVVSIGKICTQLITFFLLPLYTAVLTSEEYGVVDLLNTLVSLFLPIVTLQLEQGIFRYLIDCRQNKEQQKKVISSTFIFIARQTVIYIIIFIIASFFINNPYKYFLATNLVACMFSSVMLQICRGLGDNTKYAIGSFLSGFVTVVLNVIFIVAFKLGAYGMLMATLIGNVACAVYILFSRKIYEYISLKKYDKALVKEIVKYSLPLVPNIISWWIVNASDRAIISGVLGIAKNGIFSAAYKFSNVFSTLYNVFNLTWTESAAMYIDTDDRNEFFSKIFDVTVRFFGCLALGIIAFMPFVFPILINEKFAEAYNQIPVLMLGSFFSVLVSFIGSIYVAKKITKEIAKTSILAAIINLVINIGTIKWIGLYAASLSTVISYFTMFIYRMIDSKKYVKLTIKKEMVISMAIAMIICFISYYLNIFYLNIIIAIAILFYSVYINRNSARFVINSIKHKLNKRG